MALAVGACSGALKEQAENEAKSESGNAAAMIRIGDASRAGGDLGTAIGFYQRASTIAPNDPATQLRLATALLEMGSYVEAEAAFRRTLAADPENIEAMRGLGNIYIATDQAKSAVEQFQNLIAKKPSYQAYNGLGVAYDLEGKHAAAQKAYHSGLAENATSLTLQNNLALSLALSGDYAAAVGILQRIAQHPQATFRHRQNLALVYGLAGDTAHAAEVAKIDLDAKAVESNLAYYAWLRSQPKLTPSDVMRYSGPRGTGKPQTPAIEEGALPRTKTPVDINATASTEPVAAINPMDGPGNYTAVVETPAQAAPRHVAQDRVVAAPRIPVAVVDSPKAELADADVSADESDDNGANATDSRATMSDHVLLPEERAARQGPARIIEVARVTKRPAPRQTTHFRDMSYAQFAHAVGIYGPACEDDYKRGTNAGTSRPVELPVVDRSKPVIAAVGTTIQQAAEPVEQVAYRIDSTITLEGLRRY